MSRSRRSFDHGAGANVGPADVVANDNADTFVKVDTEVTVLDCSDVVDDTDDAMEEMDVHDDTTDDTTDETTDDDDDDDDNNEDTEESARPYIQSSSSASAALRQQLPIFYFNLFIIQ